MRHENKIPLREGSKRFHNNRYFISFYLHDSSTDREKLAVDRNIPLQEPGAHPLMKGQDFKHTLLSGENNTLDGTLE